LARRAWTNAKSSFVAAAKHLCKSQPWGAQQGKPSEHKAAPCPTDECRFKFDQNNDCKHAASVIESLLAAVCDLADTVASQLHIKALTGESQHLSGGSPIVSGQSECGFNAEFLNQIRGLSNNFLERYASDEFDQLVC